MATDDATETVLLATDGSEYADSALARAIEVATERDATLHVVCVVDRRKFGETALSTDEVATIHSEDSAHGCVLRAANRAREHGLSVEYATRHGVPHEEILDYAAAVDADLVVVGEHGEHDDHLGGVGRRVARATDREVVVATHPAPARP